MKIKYKEYDFCDENFDEYFFQALQSLTTEQKERIPDELLIKLKYGPQRALDSLTFAQKLYILTSVMRKRWVLIVEDEEGMSYEAFLDLQKSYAGIGPRGDAVAELRRNGTFLLGAVQLMKRLEYITMLCATSIYKTVIGYRADINNKRKAIQGMREVNEATKGILRFLINYEANKHRLKQTYNVNNLSEWYTLLFFYEKEEATRAQFNTLFTEAIGSSKVERGKAIYKLVIHGLLDSRSKRSTVQSRYFLTPRGRELVVQILERLFLNY